MTKTVKVRIVVGVDPTGGWSACGYTGMTDQDGISNACDVLEIGEHYYALEAELPVPALEPVADVTVAKLEAGD